MAGASLKKIAGNQSIRLLRDGPEACMSTFLLRKPASSWILVYYHIFLAIFLAYTNGAVGLCCSLLKSGARMGTMNKHNVSIFNAQVATKKLLFKLLGEYIGS